MTSNRHLKWGLWGAFGVWFLALLSPVFLGRVLINDDLICSSYPWRIFYSQCLKGHHEFLWMPSLWNGYFVHGEGQVGMLHPWHLFLYKVFPLEIAFQLEIVSPYLFIFWGVKLWLQKRIDETSALFGAFVLVTSGFFALRIVHTNALQVTAHYPWLLLMVDSLVSERDPIQKTKASLLAALLLGSMLLLGYPQYVFISLFLVALYLMVTASWRELLSSLKYWVLAGLLGTLIGAGQLLPTFEYFTDSMRVNLGIDFVAWGSLNPLQFFQWFNPYIFKGYALSTQGFSSDTHEFGLFEGGFAVFALMLTLIKYKNIKHHKDLAKFGILLVSIGMFFSLGKYNGIFYLYGKIKPFSMFRFHSRNKVLISFGMSILSSVLFSEMIQKRIPKVQKGFYFIPFGISFCIAGIAFAMKHQRPDLVSQFFSTWIMLVSPILFLILGLFFYFDGWRYKHSLLLLMLWVVVEKSVYHFSFVFSVPPLKIKLENQDKLAEKRSQEFHNFGVFSGQRNVWGYLGVAPRRELDYFTPKALQASAAVGTSKDFRYWWVDNVVFSHEPQKDIESIDLAHTALIQQPLERALDTSAVGRVERTFESPGRFEFITETNGTKLLVISESFHRGWNAEIDGSLTPIYRVNGDFMGVLIPGGRHTLKMHFFPKSVKWGLLLSCLGSVAWIGILAAQWVKTLKLPLKKQWVGG